MSICKACYRRCGVDRKAGEKGFCNVSYNPVIARAALHFGEEPCISGERGSGTIFFSSCTLRCVFCQNYEISHSIKGKEVSIQRLKEIYQQLIKEGAHNINLVTPTQYTEAIKESLSEALDVPVVWNSNGLDTPETVKTMKNRVQIWLPDIKYSDDKLAYKLSSVTNYFQQAQDSVLEMFRSVGPYQMGEDGLLKSGVLVRHMILPGHIENSLRVIDFISRNFKTGDILFSLMRQYTPYGKLTEFHELQRPISDREYNRVESYLLDSGIVDGYFQEKSSASQCYIPLFDGTGV